MDEFGVLGSGKEMLDMSTIITSHKPEIITGSNSFIFFVKGRRHRRPQRYKESFQAQDPKIQPDGTGLGIGILSLEAHQALTKID